MDTPHDPLAGLRPAADARDPRASALLRAFTPGTPLQDRTVLLGLPYDGGIPSRPGARFGPKALREALGSYGSFDGQRELGEVVDMGDLTLAAMNGATTHARVEEASRNLFTSGARPLFIGGDHGLTGSLIRGLAAARPGLRLALVTIDAHLDVREYDDEASLSSGTPFRRALETPILTGARTAMLGIRHFANSRYYLSWAREQGVHIYTVEDIAERGAVPIAREALSHIMRDADALYLSVDIDAADAAVAPGVSAVGVGGLSSREMIDVVRTVSAEPRLLGADLMELSPPHDENARTAKLTARLLLELLSTRE
ncbi:MAG TPA: agmatinase family protein [Archangium sp.]|uniref:agmatinase family protein n=1 Tax=Archangium sp. TaxID=1872627 RepID=UPI002E302A0B|nr:agmatinase family protein [Archangium sp.]HEX5745001.1 agmatinase family protein [Archangium sp.]